MDIKTAIKILTAFDEGKVIERRQIIACSGYTTSYTPWEEWGDACVMNMGILFSDSTWEYRIKTEPKYRPYANSSEFLADNIKHHGYMTRKGENWKAHGSIVVCFDEDKIWLSRTIQEQGISYAKVLKEYVWSDDGSPCGILETE